MFRIKIALLLISLSGVNSNLCQPKDKIAYIRISEFTLSADDSDEVIDMNPPLPLTPTCRLYCNKAENCTGFSIDYTRNKCIIYNREILLTKLIKNRQSSIFNKTCLSPDLELPKICRRKGWQADLWQGWTLKDDKQQVTNLSTLEDCTVACFTNSSCGSVSFRNGSCTFHQKSSRRSLTNIQAEKNSVLVDNWCHEDSLNSCAFSAWSGLVLLNSDVSVALSSAKECEKACSGSEDIPCWTYTYNETSQICNLSADNNMLIPDESSDSVYGERECMSHGRWTREGVCTCDINTGSNQKENIFGRFATFVHSVGKAVYDAVDPGHAPETACQCLEKPINGGSSGGEGESGGKTEESGGETGGATGGAGGEEHGETGGAGGEEHGGTGGAGGEEHGETGGAGGGEHGGTGGAGGEEHGETGGAGGEEHGETGGATGEAGNNNEGHVEGETEHLPAQGEGAGPIIVNYPVNGGLVAPSNGLPPNQNSLYGGYQNPQQPPYNPYNPYNYGGTYNPYYTPQGRDRREFLPLFRRFK